MKHIMNTSAAQELPKSAQSGSTFDLCEFLAPFLGDVRVECRAGDGELDLISAKIQLKTT